MTELFPPPTVSDGVLRMELLPDDALREAEQKHPGAVRIIAAGRYSARLTVEEYVWEFRLIEELVGTKEFTASTQMERSDANRLLQRLAWHRAAEVMLAVRQGHREYNRRRRSERAAAA